MRYINTLHEGETIRNVYLCKGKRSAETRNGRPYDNLILQDKTGTLDGKVWDPNSGGIADYDEMDFIEVYGDIISYNNNLQLNIKQIRKAQEGEYIAADYMPTTEKSTDGMYEELLGYIKKVENQYLRQCIDAFSVEHIDPPFRCWVVGEPSQHRRRTTADRKKKKGARTDIIARTSALIAHESTREYCCPRRG